jgi:hypothetical protein
MTELQYQRVEMGVHIGLDGSVDSTPSWWGGNVSDKGGNVEAESILVSWCFTLVALLPDLSVIIVRS